MRIQFGSRLVGLFTIDALWRVAPKPRRGSRPAVLLLGLLAFLAGAVVFSTTTHAQLVVHTSSTNETYLIDLSGQTPPRLLISGLGTIAGYTADDANQVLYFSGTTSPSTLYKAAYALSGTLTPIAVGPTNLAVTPFTAINIVGLAWDSVDNRLIGFQALTSGLNNVYVINTALDSPNPGAAGSLTLLTQLTVPSPGLSFQGADFDATTNSFYGVGLGTGSGALSSSIRGLYRLAKPISSTETRVAAFPTSQYSGFRGLAAGNGRVYLTGGVLLGLPGTAPTSLNQVFNLATNTYETLPPILLPPVCAAAAWAPGLLTPPAGTNLHLSAGGPTSCAVKAGGDMRFSVRTDNYGADASGPVVLTVTLPPASDATFASSIPAPTSTTATELTYNLASIPGYGPTAYANVEIHLNAVAPGASVSITASAATTSDIDPLNNTISASSTIQPVAPATSAIKAIFSTDFSKPTSLVPGGGGAHFTNFGDPMTSPGGNWWAIYASNDSNPAATTAAPLTTTELILKSATGGSPSVLLQRNVTTMPRGLFTFDGILSINDSGVVAFSGNDRGDTATDEFVATTSDGLSFTDIAREGSPIPSRPGVNYGDTADSVRILNNGQVAFTFNASVASTDAHYADDGNTLLVQRGGTTPLGPPLVTSVNNRDTAGWGTAFDGIGAHWMYAVALDNGHTVVVVDGAVAIEQGVTVLPDGAISTYGTNNTSGSVRMGPTGVWMIPEYNTNPAPDKIVRGVGAAAVQVFKTGDPIFVGASEHWSDDPHLDMYSTDFAPANTFFSFQPGPDGHYVIGGMTDEPNGYRNAALVYDNQAVIARANDPIDLDGNGIFDDDAYVGTFVRIFLTGSFLSPLAFTNDNAVLVVVTVRDGASALCQQTRNEGIYALVRIPLPLGACCNGTVCTSGPAAACTGGATYKGDGTTCQAPGNPITCCPANINGAGGVSVQDIFDFLALYFTNNLRADFNHSGAISVQDIFDFLAAYFAGC